MEFEVAKDLLSSAIRSELRDHSFGDAEVFWHRDGNEIAEGYFSGTTAEITIEEGQVTHVFKDAQARELRECGIIGDIERNDMSGPVRYQEGVVSPGLTRQAVRQELTDLDD